MVTSPEALFADLRRARARRRHNAGAPLEGGILETLLPPGERRAPMVTVQDASAHSLAFLGSVYGVPTVPLGVDSFGQSGSLDALYHYAGISADDIVSAAYLALELRDEAE